jgi:hypothetical protein
MATALAPEDVNMDEVAQHEANEKVAQAVEGVLGPALAKNLASIYVTIHRYTGRAQVEESKLEVKTDSGGMETITVGGKEVIPVNLFEQQPEEADIVDASEVDTTNAPEPEVVTTQPEVVEESGTHNNDDGSGKEGGRKRRKVTRPCWVIDDYHLFKAIDKNGRAVESTVNRYTAGDFRKGDHLVSMSAIGKLLSELTKLRDERKAIVAHLASDEGWNAFKAWIAKKFPNHFEQIYKKLPLQQTLQSRFDVEWTFRPLTPLNAEDLDLNNLTHEDKMRVIEQSNKMLQDITKQQVGNLMNTVFGEVLGLCEQINDGSLESGKRKSGALTEILDLLDRINNFKEFATPDILKNVEKAKGVVQKVSITQLNTESSVQESIKLAMNTLGQSLKTLGELNTPGTGKASRSIRL